MGKNFSYAPTPLKNIKGIKKLSVENAIYISNLDKNKKKISTNDFKKRIKEVEEFFIKNFGGYTSIEIGKGGFLLNNKVIKEKVVRVLCYSNEKSYKKHRKNLEKWILSLKKKWNQEKIAYEFEGDLYYV